MGDFEAITHCLHSDTIIARNENKNHIANKKHDDVFVIIMITWTPKTA